MFEISTNLFVPSDLGKSFSWRNVPKRPKIGSNLIEHLAGVLTVLIAPNSRVENLQFSRGKILPIVVAVWRNGALLGSNKPSQLLKLKKFFGFLSWERRPMMHPSSFGPKLDSFFGQAQLAWHGARFSISKFRFQLDRFWVFGVAKLARFVSRNCR